MWIRSWKKRVNKSVMGGIPCSPFMSAKGRKPLQLFPDSQLEQTQSAATGPKTKDMIFSYTITITLCSVDSDDKGQSILDTFICRLTASAQKKWDQFQDKLIMRLVTRFSLIGKTRKPSFYWYFLLGRGDRPGLKGVKEEGIFEVFL